MKTLMALVLAVAVLSPAVAFAGSSTDAALGLSAFAVFNQLFGGTGVFQPYQPPPQVLVVQPPAPTYYYYAYPAPSYYAPVPEVIIQHAGWCPPGLAKQSRCYHRHHHDYDDDD